jgi:hypothetical protein
MKSPFRVQAKFVYLTTNAKKNKTIIEIGCLIILLITKNLTNNC